MTAFWKASSMILFLINSSLPINKTKKKIHELKNKIEKYVNDIDERSKKLYHLYFYD